jgi:hypothetical protein
MEVSKEYELFRDRDVEPHTAIFGGVKLSEELRTSFGGEGAHLVQSPEVREERKGKEVMELLGVIEELRHNTSNLELAVEGMKTENRLLH